MKNQKKEAIAPALKRAAAASGKLISLQKFCDLLNNTFIC